MIKNIKYLLLLCSTIPTVASFAQIADEDLGLLPVINREMSSYEFSSEGMTFRILNGDNHEVSMIQPITQRGNEGLGYSEQINEVPETIVHNGEVYTIVEINGVSFIANTGVTLPSSLTSISGFVNSEFESINLPEKLKYIKFGSFEKCNKLKEIKLPNALLTIDDYSFNNNDKLEKIEFGNYLMSIGANSFRENPLLKEVILPNSITSIGKGSFYRCYGLTKVRLPKYLPYELYGDGSSLEIFNSCSNIRVIEWDSKTPIDLPNSFKSVNRQRCTVVVPDGYSDEYLKSPYWSEFNIVEKSNYLTTIDSPAIEPEDYYLTKFYLMNGIQVSSEDEIEKGQPYVTVSGPTQTLHIK